MIANDPLGEATFRYDSSLVGAAMLGGGAVLLAVGVGAWLFAEQLGLDPGLPTIVTPLTGGLGLLGLVIAWPDVEKIVVEKAKRYNTRGRHTASTWRVKIVGEEEKIDLSGSFLGLVGDVPKMIRAMEEAGGVKARWPGRDEEKEWLRDGERKRRKRRE